MPLDALDHEILCLQIARSAGCIASAHRVVDHLLVRDDERGDVIILRHRRFEFFHLRGGSQGAETANGVAIERADPLSHFVDGFEQVLVLLLESLMEREKVGAFDIPMGKMGQRHERVRIGQNDLQVADDGGVLFFAVAAEVVAVVVFILRALL